MSMTFNFDPVQTLGIAIMVLYTGMLVIRHTAFLRNNDIPVPVVGGLLFAVFTGLAYGQFGLHLQFDMALKEPMMLAFFASIGLSADVRMLARGGPQLLLFSVICLVYLIVQDGIGMMTAISLDLHPLVGLLSGSITLSGGHGTGAAWAERFSDSANLAGSMELAMACATFGLILGGLIGGPVAGRLIRKHNLKPEARQPIHQDDTQPDEKPINADNFLLSLFYIVVCLSGGKLLTTAMSGFAFTLPSFVWSLLIGVVIRNAAFFHKHVRVHSTSVDLIGNLALSLFLAMALMSLRLWELLGLAGPLLVLLGLQVAGIVIFATFITFRFMGGEYDAAIVAGGHCGFGLGATPTAVANMKALTRRFGPSPQAFLVVPLMGAFFIDLLNAIVIQGFLSLPIFGF
ncbi:MAG: sodium/glutamate symporter [Gammaproteobacteria bacterium]|nr:MAG: sodium/glutamate symporter [Gammaproteobacteria bacterium]